MIYIVRHGQTDWNVEKRYQGRQDIELNETGIKQAEILKEKLKNVKFDVILSSPLKRSYDTAKIITGSDNIIIDERLIERGNGELEGKLNSEVDRNIDFNDDSTGYGIEKITDFRNRVNDFCKDLINNYKGKNVLVSTHAGTGIYIRCYFEGDPIDKDYESYKIENCEVKTYNND